jgi:hypothetical protein
LNKFYNLQDYAHFLKESYKVHNKDYFHMRNINSMLEYDDAKEEYIDSCIDKMSLSTLSSFPNLFYKVNVDKNTKKYKDRFSILLEIYVVVNVVVNI